nr:MAG TPA: hypothetical protein [Caudoviricetes sp.]
MRIINDGKALVKLHHTICWLSCHSPLHADSLWRIPSFGSLGGYRSSS